MTDRPRIFSAPMIRALLAGQKTQTRRLLSPQPLPDRKPTHFVPIFGGEDVVVYRDQGGSVWVRPISEMNDGRFEDVVDPQVMTVAEVGNG